MVVCSKGINHGMLSIYNNISNSLLYLNFQFSNFESIRTGLHLNFRLYLIKKKE